MATRKVLTRKSKNRRYSASALKKVEGALHKMNIGQLRSGKSNQLVKSRRQAIAIGLSEARKDGSKVPLRVNDSKRSRKNMRSSPE